MESLVEAKTHNQNHTSPRPSLQGPTTFSTDVRTVTPFPHSTSCNPHTEKPLSWVDPLPLPRGQDFPSYSHPDPSVPPTVHKDRVTCIQNLELAD